MSIPAPHFLLFSDSRTTHVADEPTASETETDTGQWRFVLESIDGREKLEAADEEPETHGDRLDLLAVVRGLEALDQPSRVTLITQSRYVARGIRFGLSEWRAMGWQWERFGELAPIKNEDLWRRVDQALKYHQVECRTWKLESTEETSAEQPAVDRRAPVAFADPQTGKTFRVDPPHVQSQSPPPARRSRLRRLLGKVASIDCKTLSKSSTQPANRGGMQAVPAATAPLPAIPNRTRPLR